MTKITNLESLDQEIIRLKEAANVKEANINEAFQQLSSNWNLQISSAVV